jgi:hypothetical protein
MLTVDTVSNSRTCQAVGIRQGGEHSDFAGIFIVATSRHLVYWLVLMRRKLWNVI